MRYKYRGQLSENRSKIGKMVDILDFDGEFANCDHGVGKIHIDEFNCIIIPKDIFKKDMLGLEIEKVETIEEKANIKKPIKKG